MTVPFDPRGAFTAVATPFAPDGTLDVAAFRKLVAFQVQQGITGIVPGGTTGESPTLTWDDHATMIEEAVKAADGRASVIAGTGSNNTAEAVEATRDARERGASAVLLVDCYYNGPSSLELRTEYYGRVLDSVADIPIVPYVIPGRTGCALSAEDLAILHLQDPARVSSVKEATGDLERMRRDRELAGAGLAILSGDDDMTLAMMRDGVIRSTGVISVMTNIAPGAITKMVVAQAAGDSATADAIATKLAPLFRLVTVMAKANRVLQDDRGRRQVPEPGPREDDDGRSRHARPDDARAARQDDALGRRCLPFGAPRGPGERAGAALAHRRGVRSLRREAARRRRDLVRARARLISGAGAARRAARVPAAGRPRGRSGVRPCCGGGPCRSGRRRRAWATR